MPPDLPPPPASPAQADVVIVGAGAAGLATAIFVRELAPHLDVVLLDGAKKPGAKILVSGGGRCNVTNVAVVESDFCGGSSTVVRQVLRAFTVRETRAFFSRLAVPLHEEANGKLFPDSNRARDVLEALLGEVARQGALLRAATKVHAIKAVGDGFVVETSGGVITSRRVVLATGGRSLPKSGSDGHGYEIARSMGHSLVPTTPALAPLLLSDASPHAALAGVTHEAELTVWIGGRISRRLNGSLLWTHFGISGPVALDVSRHWARAQLEGRDVRLTLSFVPGESFESTDLYLATRLQERPKAAVATVLTEKLPSAVVAVVLAAARVSERVESGQLPRDARRRLAHVLSAFDLPVIGTRGYTHAEVTAGGVPLDEVDGKTLESRKCRGLWFAGEILDVDGRLGGFNFQWAWSSARAVAQGIARGESKG